MSIQNSLTAAQTKSSGSTQERQNNPDPSTRLKTVIRRLPPNLPESVFWQSVEPWVSEETVAWKAFYPGKLRKRLNKESIPSRAYLLFKHEEFLAAFGREYDGHLFRDKQGNESQAVVEFALNQKVPTEKRKADAKHATIQQDEDYLSFVAALEDPGMLPEVSIETLLASTIPPEEPKTTPLLAALQGQKQAAQEKKITIVESARARKATVAAVTPVKQEAEPGGRRSRRGKGSQPTPQITAIATSTTKASSSRGRGSKPPVASAEPTTTPAESTTSPKEGQAEAPQKRNRPVVGLQSRHLKAALSGVGVQIASPPTSTTPLSPDVALPASTPPSEAPLPKTPRSRGEKKDREGGGRSGKEKGRPRPTSATARPSDPAPPRILTRQEPPPPGLGLELLVRDRPSATAAKPSVPGATTTTVPIASGSDNAGKGSSISGDTGGNSRSAGRGGGRGRGGRRGRG